MKTKPQLPITGRRALTAAALLLSAGILSAQLPEGSSLKLSRGSGNVSHYLDFTDPGDHTWILQSSPDLTNWTNADTCKVHNGSYRLAVSAGSAPARLFYRGVYDPTEQTMMSTVATALLLPAAASNYANPVLPARFLQQPIVGQDNTPATNLVTNAGATLGRVLFYDKRLSQNGTVSCSSCHQQAHGFSDPNRFSTGFHGGLTGRNSMGLANARWYQRRAMFWDERAATLEIQVLQPIQNAVEMGLTLTDLETKVGAEPYYGTLFTSAFGTPQVTSDRISRALAQFVRSIISTQTKFDTGAVSNFTNFTAQEEQGRQLFNGTAGCAACHGTDNFVPGGGIFNNGLENPYVDKGVGAVTGRTQDEGLFKVPSLRNIALTAPYMHDGRFATLDQVIAHYNTGVVNHPNLSPQLRNPPGGPNGGQPRRLGLTPGQAAALVAFLKTLSDTSLPTDPKLSDPFNYGN